MCKKSWTGKKTDSPSPRLDIGLGLSNPYDVTPCYVKCKLTTRPHGLLSIYSVRALMLLGLLKKMTRGFKYDLKLRLLSPSILKARVDH